MIPRQLLDRFLWTALKGSGGSRTRRSSPLSRPDYYLLLRSSRTALTSP